MTDPGNAREAARARLDKAARAEAARATAVQWRLASRVLVMAFEPIFAPIGGYFVGRALTDHAAFPASTPWIGLCLGFGAVFTHWIIFFVALRRERRSS